MGGGSVQMCVSDVSQGCQALQPSHVRSRQRSARFAEVKAPPWHARDTCSSSTAYTRNEIINELLRCRSTHTLYRITPLPLSHIPQVTLFPPLSTTNTNALSPDSFPPSHPHPTVGSERIAARTVLHPGAEFQFHS